MLIQAAALPRGLRVAIVASCFNAEATSRLLEGALARLREVGLGDEAVDVARVPGAFEIPGAALRLAETGRYGAVVCLGALIRGETPHFDFIAQACSKGIMDVALATGLPVAFGVLTCDTDEQALARAGGAMGNKGVEAVDAALDMARLYESIGPVRPDPGPPRT